jgi:pre-mRNA-processing factor 19
MAHGLAGTVYEKRLIEAYILENGFDPINGEALTVDDLIELKSQRIVRPRPPTLTSIPSLLSVFQEEWDALALETFTLKKSLAETRQELSTALYQHDAAVRVIARLTKERDEARDALSKVNVGARAPASNGDAMQVDSAGLPEAIVAKVESTQEKYVYQSFPFCTLLTITRLSKTRRKRPVPEDWATPDDISSFARKQTSEPLYPGASFLSLHDDGDLAVVGGVDGIAGVYSISQQRIVQVLKGGGGPITDAVWVGSRAVVSSQSGRIKVFEGQEELSTFSSHAGSTTGIALHPSGDILASVGDDKSYVLYDLVSMSTITQVYTNSGMLGTILNTKCSYSVG